MDSLVFARLALVLALFSVASTASAQTPFEQAFGVDGGAAGAGAADGGLDGGTPTAPSLEGLPPLPPAPGAPIVPTLPPALAPGELPPLPPAPDGHGLPSNVPAPYALATTRVPFPQPVGPGLRPPRTCWDPDANLTAGRPRDTDRPLGRCRRVTAEMVELYISSGLVGAASGLLLDEDDRDATTLAGLTYVIGPLAALGLTYGLDRWLQLDGGLPGSIATGFALGALEYVFLSSLVLSDDAWGDGPSFAGMWLSSIAGGVAFGLIATQTQPTRAEVALVRSGAIWAGWVGLMTALAADFEDGRTDFAVTFGAMNAGVLLATLLSRTAPLSRGQVLGLDLGGLAGSLLGFLVGTSLTGGFGSGGVTPELPLAIGIGTVAGMIIGVLIGSPNPRTPEEAHARGLAFEATPFVEPRLGGGFTAGLTITM